MAGLRWRFANFLTVVRSGFQLLILSNIKVFAMFKFIAAAVAVGLLASTAAAQDPPAEPQPTKATFLITGLHCPPCTRTVEASLLRTKGVRSVSVDWRTQNAKVEFDEQALPAQVLARQIAATPHMMGRGMQYGGWLALRAEGVKDERTAEAAKATLMKVPGVVKVIAYPDRASLAVAFDATGKATSNDLIAALKEAGIEASNL